MASAVELSAGSTGPFDAIVEDLQRLRAESGDVSYAEIASRIARTREAQGQSPAAARVARSTVFDVFRPGRRRINAEFVGEIVLALGADDATAESWRRRCIDARTAPQLSSPATPPEAIDDRWLKRALIVALLAGCVGLNLFGGSVVSKFELPLWLDMIGTAIAAIALGPWTGALVAFTTSLLGTFSANPVTLAYALVGVAGALVWGYGVRRFDAERQHVRFLLLNVVVALVCTVIAVPISVFVFGGVAGHASDSIAAGFVAVGHSLWMSVFSANILSSLVDKLIAGYVALFVARALAPLRLRSKNVIDDSDAP